jgi:hypothetical protein
MARTCRAVAPCVPAPACGLTGRSLNGLGCEVVKRTPWIELIEAGVVLALLGAVVRFTTTVHPSGFNVPRAGDVLLAVDVVLIVAAAVIGTRQHNHEAAIGHTARGWSHGNPLDLLAPAGHARKGPPGSVRRP